MSDSETTFRHPVSSSQDFRYTDLVILPLSYLKNVLVAVLVPPLHLICFVLRKVLRLKDLLRRSKSPPSDRMTTKPPYLLTVYDYLKVAIVFALANSDRSFIWIIFLWALLDGSAVWRASVRFLCLKLRIPWAEKTQPAFSFINPDSEPLDWLNRLVAMLWRNSLRGFVKNDIVHLANLLISQQTRGSCSSGSLMQPKLLSLDLGENPPCITSITVYKAREESLTLDLGLNVDIRTDARGKLNWIVPFGLSSAKISAPLRLKIGPLLRDLAVVGQVSCSLLGLPSIDFELSGIAAILNISPIKPLVRGLLMQTLAIAVVQPMKIIIPNKAVKSFSDHLLAATKPIGLIRIHILEGKGLRATDAHSLGFSKADPYCLIFLGRRAEKTQVMKKNEDPHFDYYCEFPVTEADYKNGELKFHVKEFQWGFWNDDLDIGFTTVGVRQVVNKETVDEIYRLGSCRDGMLHISLRFVPIVEPMPKVLGGLTADQHSQAILSILVLDVSMNRSCKPMVVLEMSGRPPVVSSPGNDSKNWEFAEEFLLPIQDIGTDKLTISIVDYDSKVSVKNFTKKGLRKIRSLVAKSDTPQTSTQYKGDKHRTLATITKDVCSFNGVKENLILNSLEGDVYRLTLTGKVFGLRS